MSDRDAVPTDSSPRRRWRLWLLLVVAVPFAGATAAATRGDLAVINVHVYPEPDAARMDNATVIVRDGRITEVGQALDTDGLTVVDGAGGYLTAGLWNCHVHLIDPALLADPASGLRDMLLSRGFTAVLDTGSTAAHIQRIRAAIARGDYPGPTIHNAGGSFVYTDGTPVYLPDITLPELATPAAAAPAVNAVLDGGADGIKIFSGSFMGDAEPILLPPEIIAATTAAAHARDSFVVAHPTSRAGLENAVANGVDILAHTAPSAGPLGEALVRQMLDAQVALIPTLKLWSYELDRAGAPPATTRAFEQAGVDQLAEYAAAGGEILFGTDVGYMTEFDTEEELVLMQRAGLDFDAVLASLTTAPAARFDAGSGKVAEGEPGDLVVFERDPRADVTALSQAAITIRSGRVVHRAAQTTKRSAP